MLAAQEKLRICERGERNERVMSRTSASCICDSSTSICRPCFGKGIAPALMHFTSLKDVCNKHNLKAALQCVEMASLGIVLGIARGVQ